MSLLPESLASWIVIAVLLFWFVGAYNRLVRLRSYLKEKAFLRSKLVKGKEEAGAKFSDYFDHNELWAKVPGHRALAMLR
eukprot:gene27613-36338_t